MHVEIGDLDNTNGSDCIFRGSGYPGNSNTLTNEYTCLECEYCSRYLPEVRDKCWAFWFAALPKQGHTCSV